MLLPSLLLLLMARRCRCLLLLRLCCVRVESALLLSCGSDGQCSVSLCFGVLPAAVVCQSKACRPLHE